VALPFPDAPQVQAQALLYDSSAICMLNIQMGNHLLCRTQEQVAYQGRKDGVSRQHHECGLWKHKYFNVLIFLHPPDFLRAHICQAGHNARCSAASVARLHPLPLHQKWHSNCNIPYGTWNLSPFVQLSSSFLEAHGCDGSRWSHWLVVVCYGVCMARTSSIGIQCKYLRQRSTKFVLWYL